MHEDSLPCRLSSGFAARRAIGWPFDGPPALGDGATVMGAQPDSRPARVIEQHRSGYVAANGAASGFTVESLPDWQRPRLPAEQRPAVGDAYGAAIQWARPGQDTGKATEIEIA